MRRGLLAISVGLLLGMLSWPWCITPAAQAAPLGPMHRWHGHVVRVEVHHAHGWPVAAAVRDWNRAQHLRVILTSCVPDKPCVHVRGAGRNHGFNGRTVYFTGPLGHYLTGAIVHLYNHDTLSRAERREVVEHELGHALGLPHDSRPSSIMYTYTHPQWHPAACDYRTIARLYS